MRPATRLRDIDAGWAKLGGLVLLVVVGVGLTAAAAMLQGMPPGLAPFWLACGLTIGPCVRWSWQRTVPVITGVMLTGAWAGGVLDGRVTLIAAITTVQCVAVAWGLRRALPDLMADRRPLYRVRLAFLARFLFAITLPTAVLAGALVSALDAAGGVPWPDAGRSGLAHGAASALSVAVLAPLMWWDQLRAVSWPTAVAAALASAALPLLAATDARLLWLAPAVVLFAGYCGSTWTAVIAVTCLGGSLLLQSRAEAIPAFDGPDGFFVWVFVVWRLLGTGLLASLWSERRGGLHRRPASSGQVQPTAAAAWRQWRAAAPDRGRWLAILLDDIVPSALDDPTCHVAAGTSLRVRSVLVRLATRVRAVDRVIGVGANGALILLRLDDAQVPDVRALRARLRSVTHDGVVIGETRRLSGGAVALLLVSAAFLDEEPADPQAGWLAVPSPPDDERAPADECTQRDDVATAGVGATALLPDARPG